MKVILIVDDDEAVALACQQILNRAGYEVVTATDGAAAIATLKLLAVDLLLVDIFVPLRDGFEIMHACKSLRPDVPVVAMSGGSGVTDPHSILQDAKRLGAHSVIAKPFSQSELLHVVECTFTQLKPNGAHAAVPSQRDRVKSGRVD